MQIFKKIYFFSKMTVMSWTYSRTIYFIIFFINFKYLDQDLHPDPDPNLVQNEWWSGSVRLFCDPKIAVVYCSVLLFICTVWGVGTLYCILLLFNDIPDISLQKNMWPQYSIISLIFLYGKIIRLIFKKVKCKFY